MLCWRKYVLAFIFVSSSAPSVWHAGQGDPNFSPIIHIHIFALFRTPFVNVVGCSTCMQKKVAEVRKRVNKQHNIYIYTWNIYIYMERTSRKEKSLYVDMSILTWGSTRSSRVSSTKQGAGLTTTLTAIITGTVECILHVGTIGSTAATWLLGSLRAFLNCTGLIVAIFFILLYISIEKRPVHRNSTPEI